MKVTMAFKTPDVDRQLTDEERKDEKLAALLAKYIQYGEFIRVELDTKTGTCRVLEV